MTTIPADEEKDTRLIADMEFANDTTPEEKAVLRKWTKLFQEKDAVQKEIVRYEAEWKTLSETVTENEPLPKAASDLARHIEEEKKRVEKLDLEMSPLWAEYEKLRDAAELVRKEKAERVRKVLRRAGTITAQGIIDAGCTGLFGGILKNGREDRGSGREQALEEAGFVRENMGGARVSLPCYVGPDRYCLIHQTIGGLQFGQKALFPEYVPEISRDLTPEEKGHFNLVENVRRREGTMRDGKAILTGQKTPSDFGIERLSLQDAAFKRQMDAVSAEQAPLVPLRSEFVPIPPFTCPEHGALVWSCRFCLAQALVNGSLSSEILLRTTIATIEGLGTGEMEAVVASNVSTRLEALDASGAHEVRVYAKVASFKRKLAME